MFCDSNNETNFPHNLLITTTQVSKLCKAFANGSSSNVKFSKTQLFKMVQSGEFILDLFNLAKDPSKIVFKGWNKAEHLTKKVQDNDFIKIARVARELEKHRKINSGKVQK